MKSAAAWFLLTQMAVAVVPGADSFNIIDDLHVDPVRSTMVLGQWPNVGQAIPEVSRLLSPKGIRVGVVTIYHGRSDMHRAQPQGGTDCSYGGWLASLEVRGFGKAPILCPERILAIKLRDSIVVRASNARCDSTERVLSGTGDPTNIELSGTRFRIVDVDIRTAPSHRARVRAPRLIFYAVTDQGANVERAKALTLHLGKLVPELDVTVILRNDRWFIMECEFPILSSLLNPRSEIPSKKDFLKSKQAACAILHPLPVGCY